MNTTRLDILPLLEFWPINHQAQRAGGRWALLMRRLPLMGAWFAPQNAAGSKAKLISYRKNRRHG